MIPLIQQHRSELIELCRRYRVRRLDLFGSAVQGRFDPLTSDLDFVVELADRQPTGGYADRYLGLADALELLFQRPVDLITFESIRNPYFRQEVEETRRTVYEQPEPEAVV